MTLAGISGFSPEKWLRNRKTAAKVGDYAITVADAEYRDQVIRAYYPKREILSRGRRGKEGLNQLVRAMTSAEILNRYGVNITEEDLTKEEARIEKTTLLPDKLEEIQKIFEGDRDAYRRVFVLPAYAEREIYFGLFLRNPKIHSESLEAAGLFLKQALENKTPFRKLAASYELKAMLYSLSPEHGLKLERRKPLKNNKKISIPMERSDPPEGVKSSLEDSRKQVESNEARRWTEEVISHLRPGQVFDKVVDMRLHWGIVHYLGPSRSRPGIHDLEIVFIPKRDYEEWLKEEKAKIPVEISKNLTH